MVARQKKDVAEKEAVVRLPVKRIDAPVIAATDAGGPHCLEQTVRRLLLAARPDLRFSSLVVRRVEGGVCLEGIVETDEDLTDIIACAVQAVGSIGVMNRLVVRHPPRKG